MLISDLKSTITSRISTLSPGQQINFHRGRCDRDHMVVGFTTTYAISAYHHLSCEFES